MILFKFVAEANASLLAFLLHWVEKNKTEPENYPMDLESEDWQEQFEAYLSLQEGL